MEKLHLESYRCEPPLPVDFIDSFGLAESGCPYWLVNQGPEEFIIAYQENGRLTEIPVQGEVTAVHPWIFPHEWLVRRLDLEAGTTHLVRVQADGKELGGLSVPEEFSDLYCRGREQVYLVLPGQERAGSMRLEAWAPGQGERLYAYEHPDDLALTDFFQVNGRGDQLFVAAGELLCFSLAAGVLEPAVIDLGMFVTDLIAQQNRFAFVKSPSKVLSLALFEAPLAEDRNHAIDPDTLVPVGGVWPYLGGQLLKEYRIRSSGHYFMIAVDHSYFLVSIEDLWHLVR